MFHEYLLPFPNQSKRQLDGTIKRAQKSLASKPPPFETLFPFHSGSDESLKTNLIQLSIQLDKKRSPLTVLQYTILKFESLEVQDTLTQEITKCLHAALLNLINREIYIHTNTDSSELSEFHFPWLTGIFCDFFKITFERDDFAGRFSISGKIDEKYGKEVLNTDEPLYLNFKFQEGAFKDAGWNGCYAIEMVHFLMFWLKELKPEREISQAITNLENALSLDMKRSVQRNQDKKWGTGNTLNDNSLNDKSFTQIVKKAEKTHAKLGDLIDVIIESEKELDSKLEYEKINEDA